MMFQRGTDLDPTAALLCTPGGIAALGAQLGHGQDAITEGLERACGLSREDAENLAATAMKTHLSRE